MNFVGAACLRRSLAFDMAVPASHLERLYAAESDPKSSDLQTLYDEHRGKVSDKWSSYLEVYGTLLSARRDEKLNLLEIGIQNGGSLEIWAKYFKHARNIMGCDIDPRCEKLRFEDPRISIVVGDAGTGAVADAIFAIQGEFDVIIDDGSHRGQDIVRSFARYFPRLRNGGLYIVEDLHCSYLPTFGGGLFRRLSPMGFFKLFADLVNAEHFAQTHRPSELLREFSDAFGATFPDEMLRSVGSVSLLNSICVVWKRSPERNTLGTRIVRGQACDVESGVMVRAGEMPGALREAEQEGSGGQDLTWELQVGRLERQVAERERRVGVLIDTLEEERRNRGALEVQLRAKDAEIGSWRSACEERDAKASLLRSESVELIGALAKADQLIGERDLRIAEILASTSWRISKPVRLAGAIFRQARTALRGLRSRYPD